jgi:hypothetical protein
MRWILLGLSFAAVNACGADVGDVTGTDSSTSSTTASSITSSDAEAGTSGPGVTTSTTSGEDGTSGTNDTSSAGSSSDSSSGEPSMSCGACGMPRGAAIGGGEGYPWIADPATAAVVVTTSDELLVALAAAQAGDVVYIDDAADIDLSDQWDILVRGGVTLASGRGRDGSAGALVHSDTLTLSPGGYAEKHLLRTTGPGVRFTGFRLRGSDTEIHAETKVFDAYRGITLEHDDCEIDNMEVSGFSGWGTGVISSAGADIHHNSIHHNRRYGLGYGVIVSNTASALIEGNLFDFNRHSIASNGGPGPSYEARYNIVGPTGNGHAFDMHLKNRFAGDELRIHHNTFQITSERAVHILGIPATGAWIEHNSLAHEEGSDGILQSGVVGDPVNFYVADNCWGTVEPICE